LGDLTGEAAGIARCISLTDTIAEKAIEIRIDASITLPDAVIAASALSLDAVLSPGTSGTLDRLTGSGSITRSPG